MRASLGFPEPSILSSLAQPISAHFGLRGAVGLLIAFLLLTGPAAAQVPVRPALDSIDRPGQQSKRQSSPWQVATGGAPLSSASASLERTPANYFTRAGTGLTGTGIGSSSLGDVDDDGNLDLVVTGADDNSNPTAKVYLGDGSGTFTEANAGLTGVVFSSSSLGDVDNDGNLDLVVTGEDDNRDPTAKVYLGDGSGTFTEANAGLTGVSEGSSSLGDVNNDGNLDLVTTGFDKNGNRTSTLYLGDGSGNFTEANAGLTGVVFSSSSLGDVNDDGNPDLIITGRDANGNSTAKVYLGDGSGNFTEANAGLTGVEFGSSSLGDVDNDGNLDLVITGIAEEGLTAMLFLGDGSGGFTEANAGLTGASFGSSSLGNVDGDKNLDLVITGEDDNRDPTAKVYLGDGSGDFTEANAGLTDASFGASSLGDMDNDGDADLLVTGFDNLFGASARVYVNRTVQEGGNQSPVIARTPKGGTVAPGRTVTRYVEAGDPDGDKLSLSLVKENDMTNVSFTDVGNGVAEITFTPPRTQAGQSFTFSVEASDGNGGSATGSFTVEIGDEFAALDTGLAGGNESASFGDLDNDGNLDLVLTGVDTSDTLSATVYLGDGNGEFTKQDAGLTGVAFGSSSLGDVNDDGNLDLVITGRNANVKPTATLYLGDGSGGFTEANAELAGVSEGSSSLGDVDNDGTLDLVTTGFDKNVDPTTNVYLGDGAGSFSKQEAGLTSVASGSSSLGDVDDDGNLDLLITGRDENVEPTATLYLGDGSGGFSEANAGLTDVSRSSSSLGDVNNDGNLDLVITGITEEGPTATLYLGNGSGGFTEANAGLTGVSEGSSSLGDVDNDGTLDLMITGKDENGTQTAKVYLGDGSGGFSEANAGLAGSVGPTALGDIDNDGDLDLLITTSSGTAMLYENLGSSESPVTKENPYRLATYPNPVRQQATIEMEVLESQEVTLQLYDVLGRSVKTLHSGPLSSQKTKTLSLQVSNLGLSSGTYFLRLVGENGTRTSRITIVR